MNFPIVREYKTDILNSHPDNEQRGEPFKVKAGKFSRIIIPVHAPFFVSSLKMYFPNGKPMKFEEDFRIYRLMPRLTDTAAQPIACMIELMKDDITEGTIDYDIIGHFSLFDSTLMSLIRNAVDDDRPVWWENVFNKPVVFRPKLHTHSLIYDVVAFQDFIEVLDLIVYLSDSQGKPILEMKIERYIDTFIYRLNLYREMLKKLIQSHVATKNEHGLTAAQVGLEKVDNFATAVGAQLLENRTDLHLTVQGLQTIIDRYGFNDSEFLKADNMPISQFGNTNFIPPNISGSFEGFGGVSETGAMCLESDGSVTYLWNRMDGRTSGLYYSVMTDTAEPTKSKLTYTGFKYEHPRFVQDAVSVDRIAQGSGSEVILVGDSIKGIYYIGVTNGSLDPAKHVYSKIDLSPLVAATFAAGSGARPIHLFPFISVALMGDWIYIVQGAIAPNAGVGSNMGYRFFFRVKVTDVQATIDVTPVRQNVSFMDADGVQVNDSPWWRWYTTEIDPATNRTKRALFTFSPLLPNGQVGTYRSTILHAAQDPSRPGIYALKFLTAYYSAYAENGIVSQFNHVPEINYDFNPVTGVFTFTSKTRIPPTVDFRNPNPIPAEYAINISPFYGQVFTYAGQGGNILEDGRVAASGAQGFSGFPRLGMLLSVSNSKTRHATVSKLWSPGFNEITSYVVIPETIVSPVASSTNVRGVQYRPGGEYYIAGKQYDVASLGLFWKDISGKFAVRPEVTNLVIPNVVSRPLTNAIRRVEALPGLGGITVSVPSSQLDAYGIEVAESAFAMSAQSKYFRYFEQGTGWKLPQAGDDDILLFAAHDRRVEPDGKIGIVPTLEIIYPAAIVAQLKAQVQFPVIKDQARTCIVTVSDPNFSSLTKFGWLPVVVAVTYVNAEGTPDRNDTYATYMVIEPTYTDNADGRKQVTGFTVLDKLNATLPNTAIDQIRVYNGRLSSPETPQSTLGPMRTYYYLNGNALSVHLNSGVMGNTVGDAYTSNFNCSYSDRTTKRWTNANQQGNSSSGGGVCITPDNGISSLYDMAATTGGAATIGNGTVNKPLIGSLYPEVGWAVFFQTDINVTFNGRNYVIPLGMIDLRDVDANPVNKTFYIYACFDNGRAYYEISLDKRLESAFQLWVGRLVTNDRQIITIDRYNVMAVNGHRVSETKRGGSIPATSGLVNAEGQIPWLRQDELLP